jgi:ubiquinone/menaquinone biosynthesis C-methylase UbiE
VSTIALPDEHIQTFAYEEVPERQWARLKSCIDSAFDGRFTFADLGGGTGRFTDALLAHYPEARGTVVDTSDYMLGRNKTHPRKTILKSDVMSLEGKYDIVFCNWLLHHLVGVTYRKSRANIRRLLKAARGSLTDRGRLSIFENDCTGWIDGLSSWILYEATSSRVAASLIRRMGSNSAGVGVCYLSHKQWHATLGKAGFRVLSTESEQRPLSVAKRAALLLRNIQTTHYWAG